jgi:hypothetical protein
MTVLDRLLEGTEAVVGISHSLESSQVELLQRLRLTLRHKHRVKPAPFSHVPPRRPYQLAVERIRHRDLCFFRRAYKNKYDARYVGVYSGMRQVFALYRVVYGYEDTYMQDRHMP